MQITKKERAAINSLKKLAKKWPKTLWLFSGAGSLCVMKFKPDGERACTPEGSMDDSYTVDIIKGIENDGGDW